MGLQKLDGLKLDPPTVDTSKFPECSLFLEMLLSSLNLISTMTEAKEREGVGVEHPWGTSVCSAAFYRSPTITLHKRSGTRFSWALSKFLRSHLSPELDAV